METYYTKTEYNKMKQSYEKRIKLLEKQNKQQAIRINDLEKLIKTIAI